MVGMIKYQTGCCVEQAIRRPKFDEIVNIMIRTRETLFLQVLVSAKEDNYRPEIEVSHECCNWELRSSYFWRVLQS